MAFAREIFKQIKQHIRFQQANKESDSHYTILGNTLVRISNHCTYMYVWDNYFKDNPNHEKKNILSIVFEDKSDTFNTNCSVLKHNRDRQIVVDEYVYPLHGNPQFLSKSDIKTIIRSLQNMITSNRYDEPTGKAIYNKRKSINPTSQNISANVDRYEYTPEFSRGIDYVSESTNNQSNKQDTNMKTESRKRNVVRLTESKLKQIVAESVRKVLNEMQNDDFSMKCLNYLEQNEYSKESLSKVANLMFKNDRWTLYDGRHELLALATDQNGKLMYSFNQKAWQYVN